MAIAISKTPTLKGKDAEEFRQFASENRKKTSSRKEVEEAVNIFISVIKKQDKKFFL